jgi:hypothetical protein
MTAGTFSFASSRQTPQATTGLPVMITASIILTGIRCNFWPGLSIRIAPASGLTSISFLSSNKVNFVMILLHAFHGLLKMFKNHFLIFPVIFL